MQRQSKRLQAPLQVRPKARGIVPVLESDDEIIGVSRTMIISPRACRRRHCCAHKSRTWCRWTFESRGEITEPAFLSWGRPLFRDREPSFFHYAGLQPCADQA